MVLFMPVGSHLLLPSPTDGSLSSRAHGLTAVYFSVMVRLMLVLALAVCCLAALAVSELLNACWEGIFASARLRRLLRRLVPKASSEPYALPLLCPSIACLRCSYLPVNAE
jgi:hypothetical protein